jgi:hypothetical protein
MSFALLACWVMATAKAPPGRDGLDSRSGSFILHPQIAREAWMSIVVVALFLAITCWWLTQDSAIPVFDAGLHLSLTINVYQKLRSGSFGSALTLSVPYPPLSYLVGVLGIWIGGIGIDPPVLAENFVFVPLLALGCYNSGRLAFGARAGLLAVVFALGSPLIAAQFHVFMTDAPETAMVALALWLTLACERFSRVWVSAIAGVVVGLGMLSKEPFVLFLAGPVLVMLLRGGWRSWRGLLAFAIPVLVIALPWYASEFSQVHSLAQGVVSAGATASSQAGAFPSRASGSNLLWYFWNIVNFQLLAPLFVFTAIGFMWTIVGLIRREPLSSLSWELLAGAFVGWLGISATFPHDTRYSMPLLVYLAVLGTGWIVRLPRRWGTLAGAALILVAIANTVSTSFGLGGVARIELPGANAGLRETPGFLTLYSNNGFLVAGPKRDGNMPGLMESLRANGVETIDWMSLHPNEPTPEQSADFSEAGLVALAQIAGLGPPNEPLALPKVPAREAVLEHGPITAGQAPPCLTLSDGTGVWVLLAGSNGRAEYYCPPRRQASY